MKRTWTHWNCPLLFPAVANNKARSFAHIPTFFNTYQTSDSTGRDALTVPGNIHHRFSLSKPQRATSVADREFGRVASIPCWPSADSAMLSWIKRPHQRQLQHQKRDQPAPESPYSRKISGISALKAITGLQSPNRQDRVFLLH